jgi:preprotein translocase YajC subunit
MQKIYRHFFPKKCYVKKRYLALLLVDKDFMIVPVINFILPFIGFFVLGSLFILAPQSCRLKRRQSLQQKIRKGALVRTAAGLQGLVFSLSFPYVIISCNDGTKHEVLLSLIVDVYEASI